jgi:ATP-dependent DNA helicase PIF1
MQNTEFYLSSEQKEALLKYKKGYNIFITGPGGSGKSELIRIISNDAYLKRKKIKICALTGCAAILLKCKAQTLHSWAGIGLGKAPLEKIVYNIGKNPQIRERWCSINILVVDEVSMLSKKLFELLNNIAKIIRNNDKPFGGIQLIFSGDFYQLPPVGDKNDVESKQFCFESEHWFNIFNTENHINFKTIFRQRDSIFANVLNYIRHGIIDSKIVQVLNSRLHKIPETDILITKLFPTKSRAERINQVELNKLPGNVVIYTLEIIRRTFNLSDKERRKLYSLSETEIEYEIRNLISNLICNNQLELKNGCQVMCLINIYDSDNETIVLANGSQGKVIGFESVNNEETELPIILFDNGITYTMPYHSWECEKVPGVSVKQIPLIHSWALTIHKCQGITLDNIELDIGNNIFEYGQSYVALSRVKTLDGLYLSNFDYTKIKSNEKVSQFYNNLDNLNEIIIEV